MALTLDSALLTAQTFTSRHPVAHIIAKRGVDDFPLVKNSGMIQNSSNQSLGSPVTQSSGTIALFYPGPGNDSSLGVLFVVLTDVGRTTYGSPKTVEYDYAYYSTIQSIKAIEINETGTMGVMACYTGWNKGLIAFRVSSTGAKLNRTVVYAYGDNTVSNVTVSKTASGSFIVMYTKPDNTIWKRTSSDFITWSSETQIVKATDIPGIAADRIVRDSKLTLLSDDTYLLVFSYESYKDDTGSIYNLWYTTSSDGVTWAEAQPITTTTDKSKDFYAPDVVEMNDGTVFISLQESSTYMYMTADTPGWIEGYGDFQSLTAADMWIDSVNQKFYVMSRYWSGFRGTAKIDIATWTIEKMYSGWNTPPLPEYYRSGSNVIHNQHGAGPYAPILIQDFGVCLIDFDTDTYRCYNFYDKSGTYGAEHTKNVSWDIYKGSYTGWDPPLHDAFVDLDNMRLWVVLVPPHVYDRNFQVGYFDLNQTSTPYTFTTVFHGNLTYATHGGVDAEVHLYPNEGLLLMTGSASPYGDNNTFILDLNNNAVYKRYVRSVYPEFPIGGLNDAVIVGDKIFGTVKYESSPVGEEVKQWILEIDLITDIMRYHYPPFTSDRQFTSSDTSISSKYGTIYQVPGTNELIINGYPNPIVFNTSLYTWEYHNYNEDGAAPTPTGNWWMDLKYDPISDCYFGLKESHKVFMFPRSGVLTRLMYITGTIGGSFADTEVMVSGFKNTNCQLVHTIEDEVWAYWRDETLSTEQLSWGKSNAQLDLSPYLTEETMIEWTIDGDPNALELTLAQGHLFDPANNLSILNYYTAKGNVIIVQFGEDVSGTEFYCNQGTFVIKEISLHYKRGEYPTVSIKAEDIRYLWSIHQLAVAQLDDMYPDEGITDLLVDNTALTVDDIVMPQFTDRFTFSTSWTDTYLSDIITDIANRFKYFIKVDVDNKVTARRINFSASINNAHSKAQLIDFTPDDTFSDLVNRITITGQSLDDIQVLYDEECVGTLNGTVGWWGFKKDYYFYYSEDRTKTVNQPRLKVIESATGVLFQLAGGITERIRYVDNENKYCIIEIKAPNLIPVLIAALVGWLAAHAIPDKWAGTYGGLTIPWGRLIEGTFMMIALNVLGSVVNFQYEIWGRPIGLVKRDYAAYCDDADLQILLGCIVEQKDEGFLCFTSADCQYVADFEMSLARKQRNRVSFTKVTHLQDEVGDIVTVPHPYTNDLITIYVTHLKRKYKPATLQEEGYFLDEIEGWIL